MDFKRLSTCLCAADSAQARRPVLGNGWRCSISDREVAWPVPNWGRPLPRGESDAPSLEGGLSRKRPVLLVASSYAATPD
ncbi:hypothetical protein MTO96_027094 [Rhipicephalus appendiculatus]